MRTALAVLSLVLVGPGTRGAAFDYVINKDFLPHTPLEQPTKGASVTDLGF